MAIFNADSPARKAAIVKFFNSRIKAAVVSTSISTLGGDARASAIIKLSLDPKSKWPNGIYQNSRYAMFDIDRQGTIENFQPFGRGPGKMRRCTATSLIDAANRINKFISSQK